MEFLSHHNNRTGRKPYNIKRSNSFPGTMITHLTADGKAPGMVMISHLEISSSDLSETICNENYVSNRAVVVNRAVAVDHSKEKYRLRRKLMRWAFGLLVLVLILVGQITVIILKRNGMISKDLQDIVSESLSPVAERVIPELQQRLELFESRMHDTIEMATYMFPNFNETLYWRGMNATESETEETARTVMPQEKLRPGFQHAEKYGAKNKYPVIMVPGFVTSGLEVWKGKSCVKNLFRERVWGGLASAQYWLRERYCIMENLALNPVTGGDPKDIKLRSSQGFAAADYFIGSDWMWGNYWVWSKILENLADLDYDSNTMTMEAYDWRVGMKILEDRDHYFTHLKHNIEAYHKTAGEKVVLTSHSMGAIVVNYFFAWVTESEAKGGGGGGKNWVDEHVHAYVNIAGAHLGVPKAASALTSGEMSDTVFMGGIGNVVERFIPRKARIDLWTTWGSLWAMLPKGGDALWSIGADLPETISTDSTDTCTKSPISSKFQEAIKRNIFVMTDNGEDETTKGAIEWNRNELLDQKMEPIVNRVLQQFSSRIGHTTQNVIEFLLTWGGGMGPTISPVELYSFDQEFDEEPSFRTWHDVTKTPLPHAPNMKIYCLYGVGVDTERSFFYKRNTVEQGLFGIDNSSYGSNSQKVADPPFILDTSIEDPENGIIHGIKYSDGDGSVPLLSLGYMCAGPWRDQESGLNPSGSKVIIREYKHRTEFTVDDPMRKGPNSSEHVDILGNQDLLHDLLKIVSGEDVDSLGDNIISDIEGIVKRIEDHPDGGLPVQR